MLVPTEVAAALAAARDVEASCEALADLLVRQGYALPSVYLLRGGRLRCHAARGYWQVIDGFPPGVGVIGDVLLSGDPVVLPDVTTREDFIAAIPGLRGEAAVPISLRDEVVGVLSVESLNVLPAGCLQDLEVCAAQLAHRIEQLGGLPGRAPQEVLADRMVALSTLSCPDAVQAHMIAAARELSGMSTVLVARRDAGGRLAVAASAGPLATPLSELSVDDLQVVDGWVAHGTSCYFAGGTASTAHEFFVRAGAGSVLVLPLTVHGSRGGVLIVADERVVRCSTDRVQLLEQLAVHGAVTLRSIETVENLRELASTDALTAAGNNTAFEAHAEEVAAAGASVALCMIDIDHFKKVNDTYGHVAGDRLLRDVTGVLTDTVGERGRVFRLGGDEFAVVVPVDDADAAAALGSDLCAAARRSGRFTLSVGVTVTQALDKATIARADEALYEVKRRGRDGFQFGDDSDPGMSREALQAVPASLAEEIHEVVFSTDACGRLTFLNRAWEELVGVPVAASLGRPLLDWIDRGDAIAGVAGFRDLWAGRAETLRRQWRWATAPGDTRWFELWARPLRTPAGTVIGAVGTLTDVTARRRAEDALRTQLDLSTIITRVLERFADLDPDDVDEGIDDALAQLGRFAGVDRSYLFRFSADQTLISNTHEWCATGVSAEIDNLREMPAELVGGWLQRLRRGQAVHVPRVADLPDTQRALRAHLQRQAIQSLVVVPLLAGRQLIGFLGFDSVEDERVWSDQEIALLRSVANVLVGVVSRRDAAEQLTRQALLDGLTSLPNRVSFRACVQEALGDHAEAGAGHVALLAIDLDGFKLVNHSLGQDAADEVLRTVARRVSATLRNPDVIARVGGDQFAVLCSGLESTDAGLQIAQRIADAVREPMAAGDGELYVTASIGVAFLDGAAGVSGVLADADTALRRAKRRGRDRIEVFTEELRARVSQRLAIAADLRRAINDGHLRLAYQPIVELATGTVTAAEALVRWDHPRRGPVPAPELVSVAEETGLILGLGRWVLLHACRQLARWRAAGAQLSVSVNLSAQQLSDDGLLDTVAEATTRAGIGPGALTLELTESTLMTDTSQALSVLRALTDFGVRLSIDDFGTGFSSLSYLKRFPVDELKIDRSFVRGLGSDAEDSAIVAAIHSLARALSLHVVAEGVESTAQRAALLELGCDTAQGHWFSPAVDGERLLATISAR